MLTTTLVLTLLFLFFCAVGLAHNSSALPPRWAAPRPDRAHGHSAGYWHWRYRVRTHQLYETRVALRRQWKPTVDYALRLASAVSGVSYWQMRAVSYCESTHNPFAANGQYKGLFQLSWSPFGFSPFDPIANALSAAFTVRHDGSWRQWSCQP